jgi:acetyl-CoA carboxylase biotin carboxyl carrier protein
VADEVSKVPPPFDVRTIKDLVTLMSRHDLDEIDLRDGAVRIRLRRGGRSQAPAPAPAAPPAAAPPPAAATPPAAARPEEPARPAKPLHEIKSPTPGTFYAAPSPDAENFVRVGSRVTPDTVVCISAAM